MSDGPESITLFTHSRTEQTSGAVERVLAVAREAGVEVRIPGTEVEKHSLAPQDGVVLGADPDGLTDLAVVLGGDGTILSTLRLFAGRDVPVFAVNYGAIGFLSTVEPSDLEDGILRALAGEFDLIKLPVLVAHTASGDRIAVNDVSVHRLQNGRVAELAYTVHGQDLGEVRCDGLVVSTPAGSTGYNLANGGPVLAWGVEGFVVSFIAPHTLTARSLVVGPGDLLEVTNRSTAEEVELTHDGRPGAVVGPGESITVSLRRDSVLLAQRPGTTFYGRLREKFGRLAY